MFTKVSKDSTPLKGRVSPAAQQTEPEDMRSICSQRTYSPGFRAIVRIKKLSKNNFDMQTLSRPMTVLSC